MGRLKKDHSGYKTSGLWLKYKYPQINEDETVVRASRKNKRKWCRGKVGIPHVKELVKEVDGWLGFSWTEYKCKNCGKRFFN